MRNVQSFTRRPPRPSRCHKYAAFIVIFLVFVATYIFVLALLFGQLEPDQSSPFLARFPIHERLSDIVVDPPSSPSDVDVEAKNDPPKLKLAADHFDSTLPDDASIDTPDSPDKPYFAFVNDMNPKSGFRMFPKYMLKFDPAVAKYPVPPPGETCENFLLKNDVFKSPRDFEKNPITIVSREESGSNYMEGCAVKCLMTSSSRDADGDFDVDILRSMESAVYYSNLELREARPRYKVVMTTRLDSDVPVGYFSWAEYDLLSPVSTKSRNQLASAVISNCAPNSFRKEAVDELEKHGVTMDKYGACFQNRYSGKKTDLIKSYPFHLAFENSIEPDYVTEKFWFSLEAGTVPVVIGAPNIHDFAPSNNSILYIPDLESVSEVARRIKQLQEDPVEYDKMLAWKNNPSQQFLALIDMAVVHSSCRLCIHKATLIRFKDMAKFDEEQPGKRACRCQDRNSRNHHLLVRERGKFEYESIILKFEIGKRPTFKLLSDTIVEHFSRLKWTPIWKQHRRDFSKETLRLHKIYAVGLTQRAALYEKEAIDSDSEVIGMLQYGCPSLEVVFV